MARFLVYSDLHYEFGSRFMPPDHLKGTVDGVLLAGDISGGVHSMRHARQISDAVEAPAFLITGNHEFYGHVVEHLLDELRALSTEQVRFLECDMVEIAGTRILGTTLWTDFNLNPELRGQALSDIGWMLNDYKKILRVLRGDNVCRIDTDYILAAHVDCRKWLAHELEASFEGPTIVLTHTAPSRRSITSHGSHQVISAAFASDLEQFILDHKIDLWAHGHVHDSVDYMVGNTRIVSNPYGYERHEQNREFNPEFIVEV